MGGPDQPMIQTVEGIDLYLWYAATSQLPMRTDMWVVGLYVHTSDKTSGCCSPQLDACLVISIFCKKYRTIYALGHLIRMEEDGGGWGTQTHSRHEHPCAGCVRTRVYDQLGPHTQSGLGSRRQRVWRWHFNAILNTPRSTNPRCPGALMPWGPLSGPLSPYTKLQSSDGVTLPFFCFSISVPLLFSPLNVTEKSGYRAKVGGGVDLQYVWSLVVCTDP